MPSLAEYLPAQDSLNAQAGALMPSISPQLAPDLAQRSAQSIMATSPQMTRQAQSAAMGGLTPSSMRSMMAPQRGGMQQANLDFSPVSSWSEGLSGGIGNFMAMRQANQQNQYQQQQQQQIMDFYREQQQAVLQQEQAKQQAEQQKLMSIAQTISDRTGIPLSEAMGVAASDAGQALFTGAYADPMKQGLAPITANMRSKQLYGIDPNLAKPGQKNPISPIAQSMANVIVGAPDAAFNQFDSMGNKVEFSKAASEANTAAATASVAPQVAVQGVTETATNIQGKNISNALQAFELANAPAKLEIERLKAQGEFDKAALEEDKYTQGMALFNASINDPSILNNPARVRAINGQLAGMGFKGELPEADKPQVVGSGKNTMVVAPNGQIVSPQDYNRMVQQPVTVQPRQQKPQGATQTAKPKNVVGGNSLINIDWSKPKALPEAQAQAQQSTIDIGAQRYIEGRNRVEANKKKSEQAAAEKKKQTQQQVANNKKATQIRAQQQQTRRNPQAPINVVPSFNVGGLTLPRYY